MSRFPAALNRLFCIWAMPLRVVVAAGLAAMLMVPGLRAQTQKPDESQDKHLDIRSSVGDLHVGKDADAQRAGLPLYPGARLREDEHRDRVNLGILTEGFGMKLVVANYDSDDAPARVVEFYRDKLKKYGKVLECHTREHGGDIHTNVHDDKEQHVKELKCDDDNTGPVTELKVGTEENQHIVAIEPADAGKGSIFTLVYVHTRGKQGEL